MSFTVGFQWTESAIAELRKLCDGGCSDAVIAAKLGVTRNSVIGRRHRSGITRTVPSTETKKRAKRTPFVFGNGHRKRPDAERRPLYRMPSAASPRVLPDANLAGPSSAAVAGVAERRLRFVELGQDDCRWPLGGPLDRPEFFCGAPSERGMPYCPHHCSRAFARRSNRAPRICRPQWGATMTFTNRSRCPGPFPLAVGPISRHLASRRDGL